MCVCASESVCMRVYEIYVLSCVQKAINIPGDHTLFVYICKNIA